MPQISSKKKSIFCICFIFLFSIIAMDQSAIAQISPSTLKIQHWQTSNGIPVYFVAEPEPAIFDIAVIVDAGSARDGQQFGIAGLTAGMLNLGAGNLSAEDIASRFDDLGAIYSANTNQDFSVFQLRSLTKLSLLNPALNLFTQILTQADFPEKYINQQKLRTEQSIRSDHQDPNTVAMQALFQNLYAGHPYSHPVSGTLTSVAKLTRTDAMNFYNSFYTAPHIQIAMVGALDTATAKNIAEQLAKKFPAGKAGPAIPMASNYHSSQQSIPFPANQSSINLGEPGVDINAPDYFSVMVGNYILGDGMVSRLVQTVREKNGLSYDIRSYLAPMVHGSAFIASLQTRAPATQQALKLTQQVIANFIQNGPTQQELEQAKQYLLGNLAVKLDSNQAILGFLTSVAVYHRPLDYLQTYGQKMAAVSVNSIRQAFQQHFGHQLMTVVIVGPNQGHP